MKRTIILSLLLAGMLPLRSQTTLSGDHIITGDLSVGDGSTKGNLSVAGETGSAAAPGVKVTGDGGVLFEGTVGTGQMPTSSATARFLWYPKKTAFRGGPVLNSAFEAEWAESNIGDGSFAFGRRTQATGLYSVALGYWAYAHGDYSAGLASGGAWGYASFAVSNGYAYGDFSTAMSGGYPMATKAVSMNDYSWAAGPQSVAMAGSYTAGNYCVGMAGSSAVGSYTVSMSGSSSLGDYSVSMGQGAVSASAYSVVIGRNNTIEGNATTWIETDPLFLVGNGTGNLADPEEVKNRNAFAIYKNGQIKMQRQGDILMGEFGN